MGNNKNGFQYENNIINCLKNVKVNGLIIENAGASAHAADADMRINNKIYNIEIKLNSNAQMGGTSVKFENNKFIFNPKKFDDDLSDIIERSLNPHAENFNQLLSFISEKEGKEINSFPVNCSKDVWELAQKNNLLVNVKIPYNLDFIFDHYYKKNTHYIQIGNAGLFYMKDNPANLNIPQLKGKVNIEIRTGRSGSRLSNGIKIVTAGIRVQGRLKTSQKSSYTLDNEQSIRELLFHKPSVLKSRIYILHDL